MLRVRHKRVGMGSFSFFESQMRGMSDEWLTMYSSSGSSICRPSGPVHCVLRVSSSSSSECRGGLFAR